MNRGQSLLELIIAIGIFVITVSGLVFFILNNYVSGRLISEITIANFLAEEGLEATKSIKDNNWSDLVEGNHGLAIFGNHWFFQGTSEDISGQLREGTRVIAIEEIGVDRKKIISGVNWQFNEGRTEEVKLVTYLTNWQKGIEIRKPTNHADFSGRTSQDARAYDYPNGTTYAATRYDFTANPSITFHTWENSTRTYNSLVLKYRYHAKAGINDRYAVAYSTTGCTGTFTDLITPTSAGAPDSTISVSLSPKQNLTQLCLKIYSQRVGGADVRRIYTRDIWTEGTY